MFAKEANTHCSSRRRTPKRFRSPPLLPPHRALPTPGKKDSCMVAATIATHVATATRKGTRNRSTHAPRATDRMTTAQKQLTTESGETNRATAYQHSTSLFLPPLCLRPLARRSEEVSRLHTLAHAGASMRLHIALHDQSVPSGGRGRSWLLGRVTGARPRGHLCPPPSQQTP